MSKSRANKQNRLRAQIKRQRNDVYKFKGGGGKEMKKIKFFPAPHVEVRVSVTDEMAADLRECRRMAEETNYDNISELERVLGEPLRGYSLESIEEREKARL